MDNFQAIEFRQAREIREIINTTFSFLRQNFLKLGKFIVFIAGPLMVVTALLFARINSASLGLQASTESLAGAGEAMFFMLALLLTFLATSVIVYEYLALYVEQGDLDFEVGDVVRSAAGHSGQYLLALLIIGVAILITYAGAILLGMALHPVFFIGILFVVHLLVSFSLAFVIIPVEGASGAEAIARSRELVTDHWWQTFGLMFLANLVQSVLMMVLYMPLYVIMIIVGLNSGGEEMAQTDSMQSAASIISFAIMFGAFLLQSVQMVAITLQYFNLVERKEGTGLMSEIDQIGADQA